MSNGYTLDERGDDDFLKGDEDAPAQSGDHEITTLAESEQYGVDRTQDAESGAMTYFINLGQVNICFDQEDWDEFTTLMAEAMVNDTADPRT